MLRTIWTACLNVKCAEAGKHVKSCIAYGNPYPTKSTKKIKLPKGFGKIEPKPKKIDSRKYAELEETAILFLLVQSIERQLEVAINKLNDKD